MDHILTDFVAFWVVIDPISSIPIFLAATRHCGPAERRAIVVRAIVISTAVLVFFLVAGQFLLEAMDVELPAFQIAGGLVLFVFGLRMVFEKPEAEMKDVAPSPGTDVAVFPVAIPSIASPAAMMTAVVLTDNHRFSIEHQVITAAAMFIVLAITVVVLLGAGRIQRVIGMSGINVLSRVMGLVLAAVAVQTVVNGLRALLPL